MPSERGKNVRVGDVLEVELHGGGAVRGCVRVSLCSCRERERDRRRE